MLKNQIFLAINCLLFFLNLSLIHPDAMERNVIAEEGAGLKYHSRDFDSIRTDLSQYIWPTDASTKITSSFAEYRSTHFHGGIDISTNGQAGYKVFAVRDGYVYKIRITPNGYGKMLFVKHKDGYVSTYAHLQTFNDAINKVARKEQYRKETYAIDLTLDSMQLPVQKGDVIAYSGDTGFGPPHLHFELRDENLNPLNPLLSHNFTVSDNIPPIIRRVMITPLTYNSTIENSSLPKYFSRFPRRNHILFIPQTLRVHGQIGFGVDADDKTDGTWTETGIHRMELYLDDSLTFTMELNRVPAEETKEILLHYDLPSILDGRGKFQKLFIEEGNSLPFYNHKPAGTGIINTETLKDGKHEYKIVCLDIQGNRTELQGSIIANHKPSLKISGFNENEITVVGNDIASIEKCILFGKRAFQTNWTQHTLTKGRFELSNNAIILPINTKPYDVIKLIAETKVGSESNPMFHFLKKPLGPAHTLQLKTEVLADYIRFTISTGGVFTEVPDIIVQEGDSQSKVTTEAIDVNKYTGQFLPTPSFYGKRIVKVSAEINSKLVTTTDEFIVYPISPNKSGSFSVNDGKLLVSFDSGAVYKPLCLQIQNDNTKHNISYLLEPQDVLLNGGIKFSVQSENNPNEDHLGLYYRSRAGWNIQTSVPDHGRNTYSTILDRTLGELAILKDDIPPSIGRLRTQSRNGKILINFRYYDNLSGVDTDEIKLYIDDKFVIPEIDGEHHRVWYSNAEPLNRGKHSLKITVKDRAKNEASLSRIITVR